MTYRVLHDYGVYGGMQFFEGEFEAVDAAVKAALASGYSTPFIIVQVIDWEARQSAMAALLKDDGELSDDIPAQ